MFARDRAKSARRRGDGDLQPLGELDEILRCAAVAQALADENDRPLGRQQHVDGFDDTLRIGAAARRDIRAPFLRPRRFLGGGFLENVERHVEHDRTRASGDHGLPGLPHGERHHLAARRLENMLAARAHGRGKVGLIMPIELLEGAAVELAGRHIAGDGKERHRIQICVGERDRQIRRARSAGGERRGRPAGDAVIDVGHEARDGLVMHRNGLDVVAPLVQRVDEADIAVAAQAEDVRHLFADQIVDDDLAAVEHVFWHRRSSSEIGLRLSSIPIPKFASLCGTLVCELRNRRTLATY